MPASCMYDMISYRGYFSKVIGLRMQDRCMCPLANAIVKTRDLLHGHAC